MRLIFTCLVVATLASAAVRADSIAPRSDRTTPALDNCVRRLRAAGARIVRRWPMRLTISDSGVDAARELQVMLDRPHDPMRIYQLRITVLGAQIPVAWEREVSSLDGGDDNLVDLDRDLDSLHASIELLDDDLRRRDAVEAIFKAAADACLDGK